MNQNTTENERNETTGESGVASSDSLGNEAGYRRLQATEIVNERDETWGIWGWEAANKMQVGERAANVGGFSIWRRQKMPNADVEAPADSATPIHH